MILAADTFKRMVATARAVYTAYQCLSLGWEFYEAALTASNHPLSKRLLLQSSMKFHT